MIVYYYFIEYILRFSILALPPLASIDMVEYGLVGKTRLVMTNFPLFPKTSILDLSMNILRETLLPFSNVGATVTAGKSTEINYSAMASVKRERIV